MGADESQVRLDHVIYAAGPDGLAAACDRLSAVVHREAVAGGVHPRFGTRNAVLRLEDHVYIEIVDVLDHPAADKAPFGQAVKAKVAEGGGWLGWAVSVPDIVAVELRLGRPSVPGNRHRPDGVELRWRQIGIKGLLNDPALPFFLQWQTGPQTHPAAQVQPAGQQSAGVRLERLTLSGSPTALSEWLGMTVEDSLGDIGLTWVQENEPGIIAVHLRGDDGPVHL